MSYYVRVQDEQEVRRRLLESSKDVLTALKGYYLVLDIRDQKRELSEELRHIMTELHRHCEKLETFLPEETLQGLQEYLPKGEFHPTMPKKTARRKLPKEPTPGEVDRLQRALINIEDRLSKL